MAGSGSSLCCCLVAASVCKHRPLFREGAPLRCSHAAGPLSCRSLRMRFRGQVKLQDPAPHIGGNIALAHLLVPLDPVAALGCICWDEIASYPIAALAIRSRRDNAAVRNSNAKPSSSRLGSWAAVRRAGHGECTILINILKDSSIFIRPSASWPPVTILRPAKPCCCRPFGRPEHRDCHTSEGRSDGDAYILENFTILLDIRALGLKGVDLFPTQAAGKPRSRDPP